MPDATNESENQEEKVPDIEINKGVELMLRNKTKVIKRRDPKSFQFKFGQMVALFKREFHIYVEFSFDVRKPQ
jgi:hypothetical protein|tara:strand:- start:1302 stop:1520 length:219 start_codon:yes stop_codon:yes gene_type:complete